MAKITEQLQRIENLLALNMSDALWTVDHLSAFFSRSKSTINQQILKQPNFPKAIYVPGIMKPYWNSDEIKEWASNHKRADKRK